MAWTITQNNFTVYKSRLKDALHIVDFVEDRQAIRHENKVFAACISFQREKERSKERKFALRETRVAFKRRDWQGQSRPAGMRLHTHAHAAETPQTTTLRKPPRTSPTQKHCSVQNPRASLGKLEIPREKTQAPTGTPRGSAQKPTPRPPRFHPIELLVVFLLTARMAGCKGRRLKDSGAKFARRHRRPKITRLK